MSGPGIFIEGFLRFKHVSKTRELAGPRLVLINTMTLPGEIDVTRAFNCVLRSHRKTPETKVMQKDDCECRFGFGPTLITNHRD